MDLVITFDPLIIVSITVCVFVVTLQASLDEPTQMIVMHHAKPNKLQCQALLIADKVSHFWKWSGASLLKHEALVNVVTIFFCCLDSNARWTQWRANEDQACWTMEYVILQLPEIPYCWKFFTNFFNNCIAPIAFFTVWVQCFLSSIVETMVYYIAPCYLGYFMHTHMHARTHTHTHTRV